MWASVLLDATKWNFSTFAWLQQEGSATEENICFLCARYSWPYACVAGGRQMSTFMACGTLWDRRNVQLNRGWRDFTYCLGLHCIVWYHWSLILRIFSHWGPGGVGHGGVHAKVQFIWWVRTRACRAGSRFTIRAWVHRNGLGPQATCRQPCPGARRWAAVSYTRPSRFNQSKHGCTRKMMRSRRNGCCWCFQSKRTGMVIKWKCSARHRDPLCFFFCFFFSCISGLQIDAVNIAPYGIGPCTYTSDAWIWVYEYEYMNTYLFQDHFTACCQSHTWSSDN